MLVYQLHKRAISSSWATNCDKFRIAENIFQLQGGKEFWQSIIDTLPEPGEVNLNRQIVV